MPASWAAAPTPDCASSSPPANTTLSPGEALRVILAETDRDNWAAWIRAARAQRPPVDYATLTGATGYSRTQLWRIVTGRTE